MTPDSPQAAEVKAAIDDLIAAASSQQFDILDRIYHDDMRIFMFAGNGTVHQMDKAAFSENVRNATGNPQVAHDWADFHLVEADETNGHVVISRKVNLTGEESIISLSIDLAFEDDRWQITREVIRA